MVIKKMTKEYRVGFLTKLDDFERDTIDKLLSICLNMSKFFLTIGVSPGEDWIINYVLELIYYAFYSSNKFLYDFYESLDTTYLNAKKNTQNEFVHYTDNENNISFKKLYAIYKNVNQGEV